MKRSIEFDKYAYTIKTAQAAGQTVCYRAYENLVYVENPVDTKYQTMNIYVPEIYYKDPERAPFALEEAPILFPNDVGGYMPGLPQKPGLTFRGTINATFYGLQKGYVVAAPGARGRGLTDSQGCYTGTAPACIVDLKAAIRYLRHNRGTVPGNVERIISNGTSAGGALSALLGSTGNHPDYEPYLEAMKAAKERDDIFAASCYCPITNLEHGDMAYEWEFCGLDRYTFREEPEREMTEAQKAFSEPEKALFLDYINGLKLKDPRRGELKLDDRGEGSFRDYISDFVLVSAQKELDQGRGLSGLPWLYIENGKAVGLDWKGYIQHRTRMKAAPAFDDVRLGTPENELFGNADIQYRHFTEFSLRHSQADGRMAEADRIKQMNPMNYVSDPKSTVCDYFRIWHGTIDRDTSLAISAVLTVSLQMQGKKVDYALPWEIPHAGDYDLEELFAWIEKICGMG